MQNIVQSAKRNWNEKIGCNLGVVWLIAAVIFSLDLVIKRYVRLNFAYQSLPVIKNILHITVVFNSGAAFGLLRNNSSLLIYTDILFIAIFIFFIKTEKFRNLTFLIAGGLLFGGALSNFYDRITLGFVVDYLDIRIWPVFNLADCGITTGAALLFRDSLWKKK